MHNMPWTDSHNYTVVYIKSWRLKEALNVVSESSASEGMLTMKVKRWYDIELASATGHYHQTFFSKTIFHKLLKSDVIGLNKCHSAIQSLAYRYSPPFSNAYEETSSAKDCLWRIWAIVPFCMQVCLQSDFDRVERRGKKEKTEID